MNGDIKSENGSETPEVRNFEIKPAQAIQVGDLVLPPERELRLWMRKHVEEKNLPETALHLRVEAIKQDADKRGPWLIFKTRYDATWGHTNSFTFKARPETPWPQSSFKIAQTSEKAGASQKSSRSLTNTRGQRSEQTGQASWTKWKDMLTPNEQHEIALATGFCCFGNGGYDMTKANAFEKACDARRLRKFGIKETLGLKENCLI